MPPELWLAGAVMVSLTLYALGAGADFGGGVWDLLSSGPRARRQREVIAHAIGPIWEANHVWLVLVVVLLFVAFPSAFAAITIALHVPLTIMLLGIVMRGSAFTFRSHDDASDAVQRRWGRVFAVASLVTPLTLGACVGALAALWQRRYVLARALAAAQVALILWGWAGAQFPYAVPPDITFRNAAAPPAVLRLLLWALAGGAVLLAPSLWWLFRVFKRDPASPG